MSASSTSPTSGLSGAVISPKNTRLFPPCGIRRHRRACQRRLQRRRTRQSVPHQYPRNRRDCPRRPLLRRRGRHPRRGQHRSPRISKRSIIELILADFRWPKTSPKTRKASQKQPRPRAKAPSDEKAIDHLAQGQRLRPFPAPKKMPKASPPLIPHQEEIPLRRQYRRRDLLR